MSAPGRVMVTGASRGIGRAIAERLLAEGRTVVLVARDEARLAEIAAAHRGRAHALPMDLSEPAVSIDRALSLGALDGLVHAAGVAPHAALEDITEAQLALCLAVHVRAPLRLAQGLATHLRARGQGGAMVFVASTLARQPAAGTLAYAASKAALVTLARGLAAELAPDDIRVNCVSPGGVDTAMIQSRPAAQVEALAAAHALGRLGTPEEIASAVIHLLDAPWTTGTDLLVDGGLGLSPHRRRIGP